MMSSELDILIVGDPSERFATELRTKFRHWQVYSLNHPGALYGRRFRRAYYTEGAATHKNAHMISFLESLGEVRHIDRYEDILIDTQAFEDAALLREIRRSRYPSS